jgi:hypothetical protein
MIGYTYVLIEEKTIKSAKWNILFYGRRCVCFILTLKIICTPRICIFNHTMSNSKCDKTLGLLYAPLGLCMRLQAPVCAPWVPNALWNSYMCPGGLVCPPPPPSSMHTPPLPIRAPPLTYACPLLLVRTLGLLYAPWDSCVHPPSSVHTSLTNTCLLLPVRALGLFYVPRGSYMSFRALVYA